MIILPCLAEIILFAVMHQNKFPVKDLESASPVADYPTSSPL